ncbi:uncharacterized protein LOC126679419 isoform X2 [Mercurialis annua]|uniref:uncharacterized protein LOC126679419 isoform X2 n=1 Tax=Mercurialis annua TaxID=3986 RepID=UPI00215FBF28|nr:uncharacterized protein LOC126679419 isoform X2 [Mercurialis annua]
MKKPNREIGHAAESEEEDEELSSSYSSSDDEIERQIADATFEELQKARCNGSVSVFQKPKLEKKSARANKNRPMEASCKKPVTRFREIFQAPKKVIRDPRFESLCGNLDVDGFRKRYNFLYEDNLPAEREELKGQLKKSKDPKVVEQLKHDISLIDKELRFESKKQTDAAILAEHKKKERVAAKNGKQPFYLKKSEVRKQRLVEKYNKLKESGKLESFIEKRRKKNASKDHRYMPYRKSGDVDQQG